MAIGRSAAPIIERDATVRSVLSDAPPVGSAVGGIVATAAELQVAMVDMATHVRTRIERLVVASVAGRVLQNARVPVVLVRMAGAAEPVSAAAGPEPRAQGANPAGCARVSRNSVRNPTIRRAMSGSTP